MLAVSGLSLYAVIAIPFSTGALLNCGASSPTSANNQRTCLILNCVKHNPADDMKQFGQAAALVQSGEPNEDHDTREGLFGFAYFGNQWSFHIPSASILTLRKIHVSLNK